MVFFLYSGFMFWILSSVVRSWKRQSHTEGNTFNNDKQRRFFTYLTIVAFCFLLLTRVLPFLRFGEAPLGYDTGFYVGSIKLLVYPDTPAISALYLTLTPFFATGLSASFLFHFFYVLFQLFLGGGLYFLLRSFRSPFRDRFPGLLVFLFSLSVIQFLGYWSAFAQQMLAMGFFVVTLGLFMRGSLLTPVGILLTFLIHTPTGSILFLSFAAFYLVYGVQLLCKDRYYHTRATAIFVIGLLIVPLTFLLKRNDVLNILSEVIDTYGILLKNVPPDRIGELQGIFVDTNTFRLLLLGFMPFSLFTAFYPSVWRQKQIDKPFFYNNLLILYGALFVLLLLTFLPILYQSRSSIILDLLLLIFATPSIFLIVKHFYNERIGKSFIFLFVLYFFIQIGSTVWQQTSQISSQELQEIKKIPTLVEPTAGILTTSSLYGPWLYGYFRWSTMSPGYLGDTWDYTTWVKFWGGKSDEQRILLLESRPHPPPPMYLYVGERQPQGLPYQKMLRNDSRFTQITTHLWKFSGDRRGR